MTSGVGHFVKKTVAIVGLLGLGACTPSGSGGAAPTATPIPTPIPTPTPTPTPTPNPNPSPTPTNLSSSGGFAPPAPPPTEGLRPSLPLPASTSETAPEGMLRVSGGTFTMGADTGGEQDEHPAHQVTVVGFWLDRTEVSNGAYAVCVAARVCREKSQAVVAQHPDFQRPTQPVSGVSWDDA